MTRFGTSEEDIPFCPPSQTGKNFDFADCAVRTEADVACPHVRHVAGPYDDVAGSVQDTWQPQAVTRVRQIWHFGGTVGPISR
jgi:hypothetical protein